MLSSPSSSLLLLFLITIFPFSLCSSISLSSAYDVLESFGFPSGLLPPTVSNYSLDSDGSFNLSLNGSCTVDIPDAYPVRYGSTITGTIAVDEISDLSGITVKVFFIWWSMTAISVSGENLVFRVGPASASYPITNFSENPGCEDSVTERQFLE